MRGLSSRVVLLLILLLLLLFLLPLAAAPLHAGTVERLGSFGYESHRASFPSNAFGHVVGAIGVAGGERLLACLLSEPTSLGSQRPGLWTFGATPESAQPIGGACPTDVLVPAGDESAPAYVYVADYTELWRTDGTRAGTYLLVPGTEADWGQLHVVARGRAPLLVAGDRLLATDGTVAGTRELARFQGSFLGAVTLGEAAILAAENASYGIDLWRSDGTSGGTRRLARIEDGSYDNPLVKSGGRVFVVLANSLWSTDGTEAGTRVGVDGWFEYGYPFAWPALAYRGGIVFEVEDFSGDSPRLQLWWTDGTPRGTRRLTDLPYQGNGAQPFRVLGSRLLFVVDEQLWVSDGTARGTAPLAGCRGGCPQVYDLTGVEVGGALLLPGWDERRGYELWRTDGTAAGTRIVRDVCPGRCDGLDGAPVPWRGGVAFLGRDGAPEHAALWSSDGTASGTVRLAGIAGLGYGSGTLVEAGGRLYQMLQAEETGWQLWTLDGTPAGTLPLTRQLDVPHPESAPQSWARADGGAFVVDGRLLSSDGTRAGTFEIAPPNSVAFLGTIGDLGIAQRRRAGDVLELLALTAAGAEPTVFAQLQAKQWVYGAIAFRGGLALDVSCACGSDRPHELWVTDGTAAGTTRRLTFASVEARFVAVDGDVLYFTTPGTGSGGGTVLWRSDGSEAGTVKLAQRPGLRPRVVRVGEELFFVAAGRSFGPELWRTDGTPAGTRPYFDDGGPHEPRDLVAFDGALYLAADAESDGDANVVWRLDPATRELTRIGRFAAVGGEDWTFGWTFAVAGDHLFFTAAETALGGRSVFATDGTAAGTVRVATLLPPDDPGYPALPAPVALGGELLFTAIDPVHGREPWTSDGTVVGTRLLRDLVPGPQGSWPTGWVAAGTRAFFVAGDGVRVEGLFVYEPARPACVSDGERVCLAGRWEVEVAFPAPHGYAASVPTGIGSSLGPASALFVDPASGEPRLVLRASANTGGASVAAAGLTREWWIATVTDSQTGEARRYVSRPGVAIRFDDRAAFASGKGTARRPPRAARPVVASKHRAGAPMSLPTKTAPCSPGPTTACLLGERFTVRGHRGNQPATLASIGDELALLAWPPASPGTGGLVGGDVDPDAALRIAPATGGGYEVFFAALAPSQGAAVVRDSSGRMAAYPNLAGTLTLVDDRATFAPP